MAAKKQFVFIMTDTQRWDMVNCYRATGLKTPNIDALAASGVRYERAYTTQPVCGPARAGLFTGLYPACTGAWSNGSALGDNVKTIGQRLNDNGFKCGYIGKWHLDGTDYFGNGRCPEGWDEDFWYDMRTYLEELSEEERIKSRATHTMQFEDIPEDFTYGYRVMKRAIEFMRRYRDEDYLLVVSFDEPHGPFLCPSKYSDMYMDFEFPKSPAVWDTLDGKPEYQKVWAGERGLSKNRDKIKLKRPYFFGCNTFVDDLIGRVVDAVPKSAMIMYTSDHGDFLESHCLHAKGPAVYEDIARIPFIIRDPSGVCGGVYSRRPVSHISVCPTIMEYFGLPIPKVMQGESILSTCRDINADAPEYAFIEFTRYEQDHDHFGGFQPLRAVTDGRYKLSVNLMSQDELYDLHNDPYELVNQINNPEYTSVRDRLHDVILDKMCHDRDPFRGYWWDCRPWRKDAAPPSWRYRGYTRQREEEEYEPRQLDYSNGIEMVNPQRDKTNSPQMKVNSLKELIEWLRDYDK